MTTLVEFVDQQKEIAENATVNNSPFKNGIHMTHSAVDSILEKYDQEHQKRLRADGNSQFINLAKSEQYSEFARDIWASDDDNNVKTKSQVDWSRCEILILGAGYGGLLAAARLIQAGIDPGDIRMVDSAGGYGGTWWYNRYPGLMCDVESSIYMPLLEELDYVPKHKYSYGPELRTHAQRIAEHYQLQDKTLFQTKVLRMSWDDLRKEWITQLQSTRQSQPAAPISVSSRFTVLAGGSLNWPKIPKIPGFETFKSRCFHTSRWDWDYTGGTELDPKLVKLTDKRVGIIGTGATAVQAVPHLAKWAKELYVFQRTPSAVDIRNQFETDVDSWKREVSWQKGWQRERMMNFCDFLADADPKPEVDRVQDAWTKFPTYSALIGGPQAPESFKDTPSYVAKLYAMDLSRQEQVRSRVDEVVKDQQTAQKLKAWYPAWCKRPCFHDDYLQCFNQPNVTLVDTEGHGVDAVSERGIVYNGKQYDVDLLILSTGYEVVLSNSPAARSHIEIHGVNGVSLDEKWKTGIATLHGVQTNGFPNQFSLGLTQVGLTPNITVILDVLAEHVAAILVQASKMTSQHNTVPSGKGKFPLVIEATREAEEDWTKQIVAGAHSYATLARCPPSYFNAEGEAFQIAAKGPEAAAKLARGGAWSKGFRDFVEILQRWRDLGRLDGLRVDAI